MTDSRRDFKTVPLIGRGYLTVIDCVFWHPSFVSSKQAHSVRERADLPVTNDEWAGKFDLFTSEHKLEETREQLQLRTRRPETGLAKLHILNFSAYIAFLFAYFAYFYKKFIYLQISAYFVSKAREICKTMLYMHQNMHKYAQNMQIHVKTCKYMEIYVKICTQNMQLCQNMQFTCIYISKYADKICK